MKMMNYAKYSKFEVNYARKYAICQINLYNDRPDSRFGIIYARLISLIASGLAWCNLSERAGRDSARAIMKERKLRLHLI